jgi:hypothetical protein
MTFGDADAVTGEQLQFPSEHPDIVVATTNSGSNRTFFEAAAVVALKQ